MALPSVGRRPEQHALPWQQLLSPPVRLTQASFSDLSLTPLWTFHLGFSSFCLFFSLKSSPLIGPPLALLSVNRLLLLLLEM